MHLTDEQLNEYLDHETNERAQIELHLATCGKCSARLAALQDLFSEIKSLPELELSRNVAVHFLAESVCQTAAFPNIDSDSASPVDCYDNHRRRAVFYAVCFVVYTQPFCPFSRRYIYADSRSMGSLARRACDSLSTGPA